MQSRSGAIGLSSTKDSAPPPNRAATFCEVNDHVTAS